jgi:hypothetical protein
MRIVATRIFLRLPQALVTAEEIKMTYYSICDRGCFAAMLATVCTRRHQRFCLIGASQAKKKRR